MKYLKYIFFILPLAFFMLLMLSTSSCTQQKYSSTGKISYDRSSRIKSYRSPSNRHSFTHSTPVRKKYVIKK